MDSLPDSHQALRSPSYSAGAAVGRALARKTGQGGLSKLFAEAVSLAPFAAGATVSWLVNTVRARRLAADVSPGACLVISLLPDEPGLRGELDKITDAAELIIIVSADTSRQAQC
jgi:hypothetical protein